MNYKFLFLFFALAPAIAFTRAPKSIHCYTADHPYIKYTGRIDFSNKKLPRLWQPGIYVEFKFSGNVCKVVLNDEMLWGKNHNYLEIVIDGKTTRIEMKSKCDTLDLSSELGKGTHQLLICKNTEANIGYIEVVSISCEKLLKPDKSPSQKIEFIGDSITCGASSDQSEVPCGKGVWQDQHNAYFSYGPVSSRALSAQYHLSAVSGIGLMHSCCGMNIIMPPVFDKISMRDDSIKWNFSNYTPDLVTICLGQNDGIQDSSAFCTNYINFIRKIRGYYPLAKILCLTSPMADQQLDIFMKKMLTIIVRTMHEQGDNQVDKYFFSKQYHNGCDSHPDLEDHRQIANELTPVIKQLMHW